MDDPTPTDLKMQLCGAELFIDGPVTFGCDLESSHVPGHGVEWTRGIVHSASDKTEAGVEYRVIWVGVHVRDIEPCPSCGHCLAHPDDEHEPDCERRREGVPA